MWRGSLRLRLHVSYLLYFDEGWLGGRGEGGDPQSGQRGIYIVTGVSYHRQLGVYNARGGFCAVLWAGVCTPPIFGTDVQCVDWHHHLVLQ